uniref:Protein SHQ1 homolog n=1 Tax=Caligus rogercresseyi TaxID=217165 RepID=C1BNV8_CALRO|nr:SHQ1 homolog [Caligus rogercresseyi]
MLTPRFKISQDKESLTFSIYAPFTNLSSTTILIEGDELRFFSAPYYLRLHLSGKILEDKGHYDADSNSFIIRALKEVPGEKFLGLDRVTSLLTPPVSHPDKGSVALDGSGIQEHGEGPIEYPQEDPLTWLYPQEIPSESEEDLPQENSGYGFAFSFTQVYSKLPFSNCILDISEPDSKTRDEIREERLQKEREDFSDDHYLCDLFDAPQELIDSLDKRPKNVLDLEGEFSEEEIEQMIALPKKHFLVEDYQSVYLGLLDILLAYHYDIRVTEGEHCSESGWTLCKLSATVTCSEKFNKLNHCLTSFLRRSLTYPLFRHYDLSCAVVQDVSELLLRKDPITPIVKILLDIIVILNDYDERYVFNQIYIQPYATWIQPRTPDNLNALGTALTKSMGKMTKGSLELDLEELETAAGTCAEPKADDKLNSLIQNVKRLELGSQEEEDSDDSESLDESSSDCSSSSSESSSSDYSSSEESSSSDE